MTKKSNYKFILVKESTCVIVIICLAYFNVMAQGFELTEVGRTSHKITHSFYYLSQRVYLKTNKRYTHKSFEITTNSNVSIRKLDNNIYILNNKDTKKKKVTFFLVELVSRKVIDSVQIDACYAHFYLEKKRYHSGEFGSPSITPFNWLYLMCDNISIRENVRYFEILSFNLQIIDSSFNVIYSKKFFGYPIAHADIKKISDIHKPYNHYIRLSDIIFIDYENILYLPELFYSEPLISGQNYFEGRQISESNFISSKQIKLLGTLTRRILFP